MWVNPTPEIMAAQTLAGFPIRFEWVLDDLRALVSGQPVIEDAVRCAHRLGIPVINVDGTRDANTVADIIANYFSPYLRHHRNTEGEIVVMTDHGLNESS